jgi:SEC-C motif-containing protein
MQNYSDCCGIYHDGRAMPATPEALMRSRYTAYTMANCEYIKKTMQGKPLIGFQEAEAANWARSVQWLGLNVIEAHQDALNENTGFVEFKALYLENNKLKAIHEISEFHRINGRWFYVDGKLINTPPQGVPLNKPCPCGSQKKFKNCHWVK